MNLTLQVIDASNKYEVLKYIPCLRVVQRKQRIVKLTG